MFSIEDSAPVSSWGLACQGDQFDDLCPVETGFTVANGYECSASTSSVDVSLTGHIPGVQAIKDKYDRKRAKLRAQRLNREALRDRLQALYKAETAALADEHAKWEQRYGRKP